MRRVMHMAALGFTLTLSAAPAVSLAQATVPPPTPPEPGSCPWDTFLADTDLGMSDRNATYGWAWFFIKPGEHIQIDGRFPHSRYMSLVIQDEDGKVIDSLDDVDIRPTSGRNPFRPGEARSRADLGGYRVTIKSEARPPGAREPNVLYSGRTLSGHENHLILLSFRNYLTDRAYSRAAGGKLWAAGGVPAATLHIIDGAGRKLACQTPGEARAYWRKTRPPAGTTTRGDAAVPGEAEPSNPPTWRHSSRLSRREDDKLGINDSTIYESAVISSRFGPYLVFTWRAPKAPVETADGKPFLPAVDMRYWSLSFMFKQPGATDFGGIRTERTVADYQVPRLADGSSRLVVGLGGAPRPPSVPEAQFVGLKMAEGVVQVREVLTASTYAHDLGRLPKGPVPTSESAYVPGGRYATAEDLASQGAGR